MILFPTPFFARSAVPRIYAGGYFGGQINDGGTVYNLILSPKSQGEALGLRWKTTNTATAGATSRTNGLANSNAMNNANHPAAQFCRSLTINGYNDWYLPAVDELEILYYNLKPSSRENTVGAGGNANSVPARSDKYTADNPAQVKVRAFQQETPGDAGGLASLVPDFYWASNETASDRAQAIPIQTGAQSAQLKTSLNYWVRAIRRVPAPIAPPVILGSMDFSKPANSQYLPLI